MHRNDGRSREAIPAGGQLSGLTGVRRWDAAGMNLVIHEFAHKLDMRNGEANAARRRRRRCRRTSGRNRRRLRGFRACVERCENTAIDPYDAESPAEFFAVLSEVFFADPTLLLHEYVKVYKQFMWFYKQDPASRTELLLDE